MPVTIICRFSCPITYLVAEVEQGSADPAGWFVLNNEHYAPQAQLLIAQRITAASSAGGTLSPQQVLAPATAAELTALGLPIPSDVA